MAGQSWILGELLPALLDFRFVNVPQKCRRHRHRRTEVLYSFRELSQLLLCAASRIETPPALRVKLDYPIRVLNSAAKVICADLCDSEVREVFSVWAQSGDFFTVIE